MFYLYGGWASNSETLLTDTGVDLTQSHNTQCVLRMNLYDYNGEVILMEVYREKFPILGSLYRPEQIARGMVSKFDCPVLLTSISFGGKVEKW